MTQCAAWGLPTLWVHLGNPKYCAKCQTERAQMAAAATGTRRPR